MSFQRWAIPAQAAERRRLRQIIQAIADDVSDRATGGGGEAWPATPIGLGLGLAGIGLFLGYAGRALASDGLIRRCRDVLSRAIEIASVATPNPSLFEGVVGLAWVLDDLADVLALDDDVCDEVDAWVLHALSTDGWRGSYDLVWGLGGLGVYALSRCPRPAAISSVGHVCRHLVAMGSTAETGITWRTATGAKWAADPTVVEDTYVDMGVAHGVVGAVGILAQLATWTGEPHDAMELRSAIKWLSAQRQSDTHGYGFRAIAAPSSPECMARSAWCYGDPGIAGVLACAGVTIGDVNLIELARNHAWAASSRALEDARLVDASLCHGTSGIAHMFSRLANAFDDQALMRIAREWYGRTVDLWRPGAGCGGFTFRWNGDAPEADMAGFLVGASGVGLALIGAIDPTVPTWDRCMLLSPVNLSATRQSD